MLSSDAFIMLAPWHPGEKMTHLDSRCSAGCIIIQHPTLQHKCECNISFLGYGNQTKSKMAEYPKYFTSILTGRYEIQKSHDCWKEQNITAWSHYYGV